MILLTLGVLALAFGPLLYKSASRRPSALEFLDGFIFVTISGLVLFSVLPAAVQRGGATSLLFAAAGLFGPTVLERLYRRRAGQTHLAALALGLTVFAIHALVDGAALRTQASTGTLLLPAAIILHRLPVGLAIWLLIRPAYGSRPATLVLGSVGVLTALGFGVAPAVSAGLDLRGLVWFEALVAGSLLHVLFHQPHVDHPDECCHIEEPVDGRAQGVGSLVGLLAVIAMISGSDHTRSTALLSGSLFWELALESAPALLLAYVIAGLLHAFMSASPIRWMSSGSRLGQSFRGMVVGLPFPICSCGVVPLYRTLVRQGAAPAAGISFLIATPELGLDAVLISIPLLGSTLTVARVAAAAFVALVAGVIVGRLIPVHLPDPDDPVLTMEGSLSSRLRKGLSVGLGELVDHTAPWILLGLAVAAMAGPLLSGGDWNRLPALLEVPAFALLGLPIYVCASGATPLVAVLVASGASPGAALAFLLTGPATNVTTFGLLGQLHGRRVALAFSLSVMLLSVTLGFAANFLIGDIVTPPVGTEQADQPSLLQQISLVLLGTIYLGSVLRRGSRRFVGELKFGESGDAHAEA